MTESETMGTDIDPILDEELIPMQLFHLLIALAGTAAALDGGSSVWFYSGQSCFASDTGVVADSVIEAECKPLDARNDKSHKIYSEPMDIRYDKVWKNEMDSVKHGARRRSIWIDPPVQANKADENKNKGCLKMWVKGDGTGTPSATMSFTQSRKSIFHGRLASSVDSILADKNQGIIRSATPSIL